MTGENFRQPPEPPPAFPDRRVLDLILHEEEIVMLEEIGRLCCPLRDPLECGHLGVTAHPVEGKHLGGEIGVAAVEVEPGADVYCSTNKSICYST